MTEELRKMKTLMDQQSIASSTTRYDKFPKTLSRLALIATVILCAAMSIAAQTKSKGVYRIPFESGTSVKIVNDFNHHSPLGRIDMVGTGGSNYKIVAAADGTVKFVEDSFSAQVESGSGKPCTNNYVWIEHANGEWTKYSHMQKNSTSVKAKISPGQKVKAGTYLGDEGKVGCASGDHLHFEVGVPRATDPIDIVGGFLKDNSGSTRNRDPRICGISGGVFLNGESYEARDVPGNLSPGSAEVARHGLPSEDYQCLFDQAMNANYRLEWIDGFKDLLQRDLPAGRRCAVVGGSQPQRQPVSSGVRQTEGAGLSLETRRQLSVGWANSLRGDLCQRRRRCCCLSRDIGD
jgi:murein DD-endopeptidase MepM/ murein hydrolase activator NlpD